MQHYTKRFFPAVPLMILILPTFVLGFVAHILVDGFSGGWRRSEQLDDWMYAEPAGEEK